MHVCFVSPSVYGYFNPDKFSKSAGGGAQRQLYLLAQNIADEHKVSFIVGDYGQNKREIRKGITLYRSFKPTGSTTKKPVEMIKLFLAMKRANADVYISRNKPSLSAYTFLCTKMINKPWIFNVANDKFVEQDLEYLNYLIRKLYINSIINSSKVIVQTKYQQQCLREFFGVDSTIVPNGYPKTQTTLPHEDREYFLWVGHLDPDQKQPELFIDLANKVPEADFLLIGARGTDLYRNSIIQRISSSDNIQYKLDVPPNEIHQYFKQAIALINTSAYEGFPNTFLEAWRFETPVLSLFVDPSRYIDQDKKQSFLANDMNQLAELIRDLYVDVNLRRQSGKQAKLRFEQKYSIDSVAAQYQEAIEDTLGF